MMDEPDLARQLRRLAGDITPPATGVGEDLARGRRRVRRRRAGLGGGTVLVAAAVTVAAVSAGGGRVASDAEVATDGAPTSAAPTPSPSGSVPTAPTPDGIVTIRPTQDPDLNCLGCGLLADDPQQTAALQRYLRVVADHVDPTYEHLPRRTTSRQTSTGGEGTTYSLGSKLSWTNPGEAGEGQIQVSVSAAYAFTDWECGGSTTTWECRDVDVPGARSAQVATHDGVTDVAVEHQDGQVGRLTVDALFGNNSVVPVSGIDVREDDLLAAAADERLSLPGGRPVVGVSFTEDRARRLGARLIGPEEELVADEVVGGVEASGYGRWRARGAGGDLGWDTSPRSGELTHPCDQGYYRTCELRTLGGRSVFVGLQTPRGGGGTEVSYAGPVSTVTVDWEGERDAGAVDRAVAFVLDPAFQERG